MAGNVFNPNSPTTVGEEWLTNQFGEHALGAWAQRIRSRAAETINRVDGFFHPSPLGLDASVLMVDIMAAGQEIPAGTIQTATYQPNADVTVTNWLRQDVGTPLYQSIDEGVATYNAADFVLSTSPTTSSYQFRVASNSFSGTARVLNVQIRAVIAGITGGTTVSIGYRTIGAASAIARVVSCNTTPSLVTVDLGEIYINNTTASSTHKPWTFADIRGFDSATPTLVVEFQTINAAANVRVYAAELVVTYQSVENRVAAATHMKSPGLVNAPPDNYTFAGLAGANQTFVALPGGGSSWSKPASGDFTFLFRPPYHPMWAPFTSTFALNWTASVIGGVPVNCSVPGVVSARPVLDSFGQVVSADFTDPTQAARTAVVMLRTTAPAVSEDSIPYVLASGDGAISHFPDVNNGQAVNQYFTSPASTTYRFLKLLLNPHAATDNLDVRIRRVSDSLQFGSTQSVEADDVRAQPAEPNGMRVVTVSFTSGAVLVSGTQYRVELTSTDSTPSGSGWQTVLAGHVNIAGGAASFNAATDFPVIGGTPRTSYEIPFRLSTPPTAPSGTPTAVASNKTNNVYAPTTQDCVPDAIQAITVTWNATALGGTFDRYEVQRKPVFGDDWQIIAAVTQESIVSFVDYETPRGEPNQYRVRVVRTDGAESDWGNTSAGVTAQADGCDMIFCSNEDPDLNVAFVREPLQDYVFQAPARDELVQIYGAHYSVAFMECEDPGIQVAATLTVSFGRTPTVADVQIYDPLRRISRAPLPYVCVLDHAGNRFYAHLQVGAGRWEEPGFRYHADVVVTQVTETSAVAVI